MTIGARVLKTGLAVALAIFVSELLQFDSPLIAAVAAIFTIQPSIYRSWKQMLDQLQGNLLGAVVALGAVQLFGSTPIAVGLVCIGMILVTMKLRMESAIGLTLVTVVAVMEAHSTGWQFALERFGMVLSGMGAAFLVNVTLFPPRPKKQFSGQVNEAFQQLSLLLRTSVSNEMKEAIHEEERDKLEQMIRKLDERYLLFEEERAVTQASKQAQARQLVVSKQMIKVLHKGLDVLDAVEEHFFAADAASRSTWARRLDEQIESYTKAHEQILLKAEQKIKPGVVILPDQEAEGTKRLGEELAYYVSEQLQARKRLVFVGAAIMEYGFQLRRLERLLEQVLQRDGDDMTRTTDKLGKSR